MKIKGILALLLFLQFFSFHLCFAWSEDWGKIEQETGGGGQFIIPVDGDWVLTSPQGWRVHPITGKWKYHSGADLGADYGTPIVACGDGTVEYAGWIEGYGNAVIIDHGGGVTSLYGHNESLCVSVGQTMRQGERIAYCGSTGNSTGPHCHWEVRVNGEAVDPGLYNADLMEKEKAAGGGHGGAAQGMAMDSAGENANFEVDADFAKPLRDVIEKIVDAVTAGLKLIKDNVYKLFMLLVTMDIVLGLAWRSMSMEGENDNFMQWIIYRLVLYGVMMFILSQWGEIVGGMAMHGLPAIGSMAVGATPEETAKVLSDPTAIIQRGVSIIAPILNESLKIKGLMDIIMHGTIQITCLAFGIIFLVLFFIVGIQIAKAYLEFYLVILFSFTGFMFSGLKHTRRFGANSLNAVFAVSINLMFFCIFAALLSYTMENISVGNYIETRTVEGGQGGPIKSVEDLMARMRVVESYYGNYHCDNGLGYYGAYQINKNYWDTWCNNYLADGGSGLDTDANYTRFNGTGAYDTAPEPTWTSWPWSPRNQDSVARYILEGYYAKYGSWEAAGRAWNQGTGGMNNAEAQKYEQALLNVKGASSQETFLNMRLLLELLLVLLVFIFFADRISSRINQQFGRKGFRWTENQE